MSQIGSQIRKYRTAKGLTQEQLGLLVGVTTQAVSKWECGGTPDAELLPALADALGVNIDALFGRDDQDAAFALVKRLVGMDDEAAFGHLFDICWAGALGTDHDVVHMPDEHIRINLDHRKLDGIVHPRIVRIMYDTGMVNACLSDDLRYFFMMLEPVGGLRSQLAPVERLCQLFRALGEPDRLRILFYLYTRLNTPLDTSLISRNVGMPIPEVDRHMDIFYQVGLVKRSTIATAHGEIYSYMFNQEDAVVALLCLADQILRNEDPNFAWSLSRTVPLMDTTDR